MKTREDFVSNSSSCSFFVALKSTRDVEEFKKLIAELKKQNVSMTMFCSLEEANDRWYGAPFDYSEPMLNALAPGYYILCDSGEDHDDFYEDRFYKMESLFLDGKYKFTLNNDREAHMSSGDDLPKSY